MSEIPVRPAPRRLADWINPTGAKKVHSLIDKVYKQKNLEMAWECVKANRGSGGVDGQSLEEFGEHLDSQLNRLHTELREDCYQEEGREWIVDADLKDFFGSADHEKLLTLVAQRIADGRVLRLIRAMLKAGSYGQGRLFPTERGTPQGSVISPLLSNILLTPFDQEMRRKGYRLTRYADDWVVTCTSAEEARAAVAAALRILSELGVQLHPQKTRIVQVRQGFEFLGYKIKRGKQLRLPPGKIRSGARPGELYAYPRAKSIQRFMDQVRQLTKRRVPLTTKELIEELNPVLRGWGHHYKRAHVRMLFNRLDRWIVHRIWSHRFRRWRNYGWKKLPVSILYREYGLVNLVRLIPSLAPRWSASS